MHSVSAVSGVAMILSTRDTLASVCTTTSAKPCRASIDDICKYQHSRKHSCSKKLGCITWNRFQFLCSDLWQYADDDFDDVEVNNFCFLSCIRNMKKTTTQNIWSIVSLRPFVPHYINKHFEYAVFELNTACYAFKTLLISLSQQSR